MNPKTVKLFVWVALYLMTGLMIASFFVWTPHNMDDFPVLRDIIIFFATVLLTKYFFYMTLSPWYDVKKNYTERKFKENGRPPYRPRVSIIVPAWNEDMGLPETLRSILASTYRNLEVVVINDGSTDKSDAIMRRFVADYEARTPDKRGKIAVAYYYKENGGKGRALNYGIERASGDIIITIDADCILTPTTVENFVKPFAYPQVMAAVGNVKVGDTSHILGTLQYLEFLFSFYFKKAESLMNTIYIIGGAAGAFRREVFNQIGYFDSRNITEDIDLSVRVQEAGMRIVYAADAVVYTEGASTFSGLKKQRLRWKYGRFQTFYTHRALFFSTRKEHSRFLTWLILPLAIFGDAQLFLELFFLVFLYVYSMLTHDFSSFLSGVIVVSSMFAVQIFDDSSPKKWSIYALAPVAWMLFYLTTYIEHHALFKSISMAYSKQKPQWQRWQRVGCFEKSVAAVDSHA